MNFFIRGVSRPTDYETAYDLDLVGGSDYTLVFRKNTTRSVDILAPAGATVLWMIVESESVKTTPNVVASGNNRTISFTPTRLTDESTGRVLCYDILLLAIIGGTAINRRIRRGIICAPSKPVRADATQILNLDVLSDGDLDYNGVDKSGDVIWIEGNRTKLANGYYVDFTDQLNFEGLVSSDPENPVHVIVSPGSQIWIESRTSDVASFRIGERCQNVYFDFAGDDDIAYGLKAGYGDNQTFQLGHVFSVKTSSSATNASTAMKNITVVGVEIDGYERASSGLRIEGDNTGDNVFSTWAAAGYSYLSGFNFTNFKVDNTWNEAVYINFNQAGSGSSAYSGLSYSNFWRFKGNRSGNESVQVSIMVNSEMHDMFFTDCAFKNNAGHNNLFQLVDNVNFSFYRFGFVGNSSAQVANLLTSTKTNNTHIFSGYISNRSSVSSNFFIRADDHDTLSTVDFRIGNLTIDAPTGSAVPFWLQKSTGGVEFNKLCILNCAIVSNSSTIYGTSGSPSTTNWFGLGLRGAGDVTNYITTNPNAPGFRHYSQKDFRPASLSSPLFRTRNVLESIPHPCYSEDFEGVEYINDIVGCSSGWRLLLGTPAIFISSVDAQDDISVIHGTAFESIGLPSEILVNLNDGGQRLLPVTWDDGSYNSSIAGQYVITGTFNDLPADVTNPNNITASISVTVEEYIPIDLLISFGGDGNGLSAPPTGYPGAIEVWDNTKATSTETYPIYGAIQWEALNTSSNYWGFSDSNTQKAGLNVLTGTNLYANELLRNYWFVDGRYAANRLVGLDPNKTYTLKFAALRTGSGTNRQTTITVNGSSVTKTSNRSGTAGVFTSESEMHVFNGVSPDESGNIDITVNTNGTQFGYLNLLHLIEESP